MRPLGARGVASAALAHVALAAIIAIPAYWNLFSTWVQYDDEGYLTLSLRNFVDGGTLYHDVFTQYGPAYYEFWGALVSVLGLDVTMNTGRLLVVAVWVLTGLLGGLAVSALTRNVVAGLSAQVVLFSVLSALVPEPMHPSGLIVLLFGAFAASAALALPRWARTGAALLGAIAATAALTKLNIGMFLVLGTGFALVLALPAGRRRLPLVAFSAVAGAVVPFLLMRPDLSDPLVSRYAWIVALGILALGAAGILAPQPAATAPGLRRFAGAFVAGGIAAAAAIVLVIFVLGSSPADLWQGIVTEPSRLREVLSIRLQTFDNHLRVALAGLVGAVAWGLLRRRPASGAVLLAPGLVRIAVGVLGWMALAQLGPFDTLSSRLTFPLAFAWLAAVPPRSASGEPQYLLPRLILAGCAAFETLQAYPVAGTQVQLGGVLLVLTTAIVVADGLREVREALPVRTPVPGLVALAAGLVIFAGFTIHVVTKPWDAARTAYEVQIPLPFAGADRVRLPEPFVTVVDGLVNDVRDRCDTVIGYPGFGSLHLWSGVPAPNGLMPGDWMYLLGSEQQQRVLDDLREDARTGRRVCVVRNATQLYSWTFGKAPAQGALIDYMESARTVATYGPWELQVPASPDGGA